VGHAVDTLSRHRLVGFDTSIFIYRIEQTGRWSAVSLEVLRALSDGRFAGVTSVLTLMEIAIKPVRLGRPEIADMYEVLIRAIPNLDVIQVDARTARIGAELRARHGIRTPDALHIAAAIAHGATAFVTNDKRLHRVSEIDIVILDDFIT
jgi:predicted nucleic acid-binding protein